MHSNNYCIDAPRSLRSAATSRRLFLQYLTATSLSPGAYLSPYQTFAQNSVAPNSDHGRIKPPVPVPGIPLLCHDGEKMALSMMVFGHATAVQLMFTTCTTTCPIQAAIFQHVQTQLPAMAANKIQLLSLSVNPEDDNAAALSAWRHRFHAGPQWIAAAPDLQDISAIQTFFGQTKGNFADHSTQVNIVDRQGRLVWRTNELPTSEEIATILRKL